MTFKSINISKINSLLHLTTQKPSNSECKGDLSSRNIFENEECVKILTLSLNNLPTFNKTINFPPNGITNKNKNLMKNKYLLNFRMIYFENHLKYVYFILSQKKKQIHEHELFF